ncbi:MAG TPA: endolytic transglycosylase MltG [Gammaproteobacteria bacterium]|nr:endolytic transglycosylase MltG [Gammaproteobacteria bacterium]
MPNPLREWKRWLFLALVLGLVAAGLTARHVYQVATRPLPVPDEAVLEVPQGASYDQVVGRLVANGWADREDALELKLLGRLFGVTARIHAGEYRLTPETTPVSLLDALVGGKVILHSVTLPEGWTVDDFLARLRRSDALDTSRLPHGPEDARLLRALGLQQEGYASAEGWLFPETYRFRRGDDAMTLLRQASQRMRRILEQEWAQREDGLPINSPYQALILASIVEKETAAPEERPMIAGVFMNRLRDGMRLQTDPTVIYGLGDEFDGNLQKRDLERRGPYNTYRHSGLPPTPIANPGRKAIRAACQPADTDARYFVARGDGTHVFSETLAEHNRAVRRYQLGGR